VAIPSRRRAAARPAGDEKVEDGTAAVATATDVLIHAIPGEVLAPYTALVAIIVSNSANNTRESLRWALFAVSLALVGGTLALNFYRGRPAHGRRFPVIEVAAACVAFAAWGLAMPQSPLSMRVTGQDLTIAVAVISIGGAFLLGLLSPALAKPSAKAKSSQSGATDSHVDVTNTAANKAAGHKRETAAAHRR
jgi:hypothetical protein